MKIPSLPWECCGKYLMYCQSLENENTIPPLRVLWEISDVLSIPWQSEVMYFQVMKGYCNVLSLLTDSTQVNVFDDVCYNFYRFAFKGILWRISEIKAIEITFHLVYGVPTPNYGHIFKLLFTYIFCGRRLRIDILNLCTFEERFVLLLTVAANFWKSRTDFGFDWTLY